jgi:hypothetical protein
VPGLPSLFTPSAIGEFNGGQYSQWQIVILRDDDASHPALDTMSLSLRALHALQRDNGLRNARKAASAMIAKTPMDLARVYLPPKLPLCTRASVSPAFPPRA